MGDSSTHLPPLRRSRKNRVVFPSRFWFIGITGGREMRNWLELFIAGREKMAETIRLRETYRMTEGAAVTPSGRNAATLVLARGELLSVRLRGRACRATCLTGRLWATASGRQEDSLLAPGESAAFKGRRKIVIEALRTATVRLDFPRPARVTLGARRQAVPSPSVSAASQPRMAFFL